LLLVHSRAAFAGRFFVSGLVTVAIFAWVLFELCERNGTNCHPLLGEQEGPNASEAWNGRSEGRLQDLILAQNVAAWLFVLYAAVSSMT
jgi:hypothetical protein